MLNTIPNDYAKMGSKTHSYFSKVYCIIIILHVKNVLAHGGFKKAQTLDNVSVYFQNRPMPRFTQQDKNIRCYSTSHKSS